MTHTVSFGELHVMADLNVPTSCAGVLVMPADIHVGDPEGVMAIPWGVATEVADAGLEADDVAP